MNKLFITIDANGNLRAYRTGEKMIGRIIKIVYSYQELLVYINKQIKDWNYNKFFIRKSWMHKGTTMFLKHRLSNYYPIQKVYEDWVYYFPETLPIQKRLTF